MSSDDELLGKSMSAAINGFMFGCLVTLIATGFMHKKSMGAIKKEAINLGYAHMVIVDPHSSYARFQWIESEPTDGHE